MSELIKVTGKIKVGGGLNLLCYAAAGYLITKTAIVVDQWSNNEKVRKEMNEAVDAVKTVDKIMSKLDKVNVKKEETEEAQ